MHDTTPGDRALTPRPEMVVHYAAGPPFRSMMDLEAQQRDEVLRSGSVSFPERYLDPSYVETRARVEQELLRQFVAAGGEPLRPRPHYALIGRSARSERSGAVRRQAYALSLAQLPLTRASFTWGDSFRLDEVYRRMTGKNHPASGIIYRLEDLDAVLARWAGSTMRPAWQEIEIQLWFDPSPSQYVVLDIEDPSSGVPDACSASMLAERLER